MGMDGRQNGALEGEDGGGDDKPSSEDNEEIREFEDMITSLVAELETRAADEENVTLGPDGHHHREATLSAPELSKLHREVAKMREGPGLACCSTEALLPLMPHLLAHVTEGSQTNLLKSAAAALREDPYLDLGEWLGDAEGQALLERVLLSADAGAVALIIMTAKDIDRRLMMQELIEETLQLLKHHLSAHVIPVFDSSAATAVMGTLPQHEGVDGEDGGEEDDDGEATQASKGRGKGKRKKSTGRSSMGGSKADGDGERRLKPLWKQLVRLTPLVQEILELFELLTARIRVDDRQLLTFSPLCLSTLVVDPSSTTDVAKLQPIQHYAMSLLQSIFGQYEQHRSLIIEDVFTTLLKLPCNKRNLRTFRLHYRVMTLGSDSQNIQMATALVLLLLQAVITKPSEQIRLRGKAPQEESSNHGKSEGEEVVMVMANRFAQHFLEKCSSKEVGSEFRPLLLNFVEDLLVCFLMPEWPAAEALLQAFCILLLKDLYQVKGVNADSQYFLHSLDLLGKIFSRLRELSRDHADFDASEAEAYLVQVIGEELTNSIRTTVPDGTDVIAVFRDLFSRRIESSAVSLSGKRKKRKKSSIGEKEGVEEDDKESKADDLSRSGSSKVSRGSKLSEPPQDAVRGPKVKREVEDEGDSQVGPSKQSTPDATPQDLARQLVLNYLTKRAVEEEWIVSARQYHVARWIAEATKSGSQRPLGYWKYLDSVWDLPSRQSPVYDLNAYIPPPEGVIRLSHAMAVQRSLFISFDKFLFRLLALLGQGQAAWRARIMKAFAGILESDPMLMAHDLVKQAVTDRFQDESISVRQAAVDLVGKYVLQRPALFEKYHKALMERLVDKGVSVRKTIVKILRDFLIQNPNHKFRTDICRRLVERASIIKEEDTLKDLIRDTFQDMWFSSNSSVSTVREEERLGDGSNGRRSLGKGGETARLMAVALQMVEVIAGLQNTDWLVSLLGGLLFGPGEGEQEKKERTKQRKGVISRCSALVACLIDLLVDLDEGKKLQVHESVEELASPAKQLLGVISTLFVFSRAYPNFILEHVDYLLPYLKAENHLEPSQEAAVCYMVSNMVALVIPHLKNPDKKRMQGVVDDLVKITYKFSSSTIHAAVQCLANIATHVMKDPENILKLAKTFYTVLKKCQGIKDFTGESDRNRSSAHRALVVLGCITRYYNFKQVDPHTLVELPKNHVPSELSTSNIYALSYRMLALYLRKDVETETKAIQAMCSLFTGCMPLMLTAQRDGLIGRILGSPHKSVALQTLRSFREVLLAEENRVESGAARDTMTKSGVTLKQQVKGDQDAEASIVGGVMQEHLDTVRRLLFDSDVAVRGAGLSLLGVLHRQGLVNPLQTIPSLIALQGDTSPSVRADAYRQLVMENEKHPEFLSSRILDGVCQCYHFQSTALGKASALTEERDAGIPVTSCCIMGPLYSSCIRSNRKNRFSFLRNLLSLFEEETARGVQTSGKKKSRLSLASSPAALATTAGSKSQKGSLDPHFLAFVAQLMAYLPYDVQEEPLFIIYTISRHVSLNGSALLGELKELFSQANIRVGGEEAASSGGGPSTDGTEGSKRQAEGTTADSDDDTPTLTSAGPNPMEVDGGEKDALVDHHGEIPPPLLAQLKDKCAAAMAFCVLLRLKFFLKNVYSLSDDKCMEYKPQEMAKSGEKSLFKPESFPDFNLPDNLLVPLGQGPELVAALTLQFNEFRRLIRGDPADFKLHKVVKAARGRKSSTGAASLGGPMTPGGGGGGEAGSGRKRRGSTASARGGRGGGRGGRRGSSAAKRRKVSEEYEGESSSEESSGPDEDPDDGD